jgi:predicted nucleic acid-binding protein
LIHLDTSFLIRSFVRGSLQDQQLRSWLRSGTSLAISAICWAEFLCGPVHEHEIELLAQVVPDVVPFLPEDAVG